MKHCRFKLKALAGHSKAGQKVTYGAIKGAKFKQLALVHVLSLPCCVSWHTYRNTRLALTYNHTRYTQAAILTLCLCAIYDIVRVLSHCSLTRCRFDPMLSDQLRIVLTTL